MLDGVEDSVYQKARFVNGHLGLGFMQRLKGDEHNTATIVRQIIPAAGSATQNPGLASITHIFRKI